MISGGGIVESARHGDLFAYQTLVERYQAAISRYLYRLVGDEALARDLTLQTFVTGHRKLKNLDQGIRFEGWLHRLATGAAEGALQWRRLTGWLPNRAPAALPSAQDDLEGQALQKALERLPVAARVCLLLLSQGGFTYDEISTILHVSMRTVRERIAGARSHLRRLVMPLPPADSTPDCAKVAPLLSAYVDHQLSNEERATADQHLASCAGCRATLANYQELDRRLARIRQRGPSASVAYDVASVLRGDKRLKPASASQSRRGVIVIGLALFVVVLASAAFAATRLGKGGRGAAIASPGMLYVGLQNLEGQVAVVDVQSAKLVATLSVGGRPLQVLATRDGRKVFVLGDNGILTIIDAVQNVVTDRYLVGGRAAGLALSPDDSTLYVTLTDRRALMAFDSADGRQIAEIRVGRTPREVAITPDGQWVLVYNSGDSTLSKIKAGGKQESKILTLVKVGEQAQQFSLHPIATSPDGRRAYVGELNRERIWIIDLLNDDVRSVDVPLRDLGREMLVAPDGQRLYVTHGDPRGARAAMAGLASMTLPQVERQSEIRGYYIGMAMTPDGKTIFATDPDNNGVIFADALTLETIRTVLVGERPATMAYAPKAK